MDASSPGRRPPYPGLDPFGFAQQDLFFGRDTEGRAVAAIIGAEPLSVLTGASGTGKSSLLRAMVIPTLVQRNWCVVYAHPAGNPVQELMRELLSQSVPDIDAEIALIERLLGASAAGNEDSLTADSVLSDAHEWYSALPHDDARRVTVVGDVDAKIPRIPLLAMVLAGSVRPERAAACLANLAGVRELGGHDGNPSFREICALRAGAAAGRERLVAAVMFENPSIVELASRLWRDWLQPLSSRGLAFILDQAEELYTAFGPTRVGLGVASPLGRAVSQPVELRDRLFAMLPDFLGAAQRFPLRLCISLRPEWYTDLRVSVGPSMPDESRALYILTPMSREQAARAIEEPASHVRAGVDSRAQVMMLDALEREGFGRGLDPFLLGLLCRLAWEFATDRVAPGRIVVSEEDVEKIAAGPPPLNGQVVPVADPTGPPPLVSGALLWLLHRFLSGLDVSEQFDALDMLDALFTSGGTRRIVPEVDLIGRPLRPRERLKSLLDKLEDARLVRRLRRGGETFVEIRHERLAEPLLVHKDRLERLEQTQELTVGRYRGFLNRAIELLLRPEGKHLVETLKDKLHTDVLPAWARASLRFNREAVAWDRPAARTLMASLLYDGPASSATDTLEYRQTLRELMGDAPTPRAPAYDRATVKELEEALLRGAPVTLRELAAVHADDVAKLSIDARLLLLDCVLRHEDTDLPTSRADLVRFTKLCLGVRTQC